MIIRHRIGYEWSLSRLKRHVKCGQLDSRGSVVIHPKILLFLQAIVNCVTDNRVDLVVLTE